MINYTLVIILAIYPHDYRASSTSSISSVSGFTTEQACINASNKIKVPSPSTQYVNQKVTFTCVANSI